MTFCHNNGAIIYLGVTLSFMVKMSEILIDAFPLYGKSLWVKTSDEEIKEVISVAHECMMTDLEKIYKDMYRSNIDLNINKITSRESWELFLCEIIISYCLRYVLYKKPIPIKVI